MAELGPDIVHASAGDQAQRAARGRGPITLVLDLFSSVWLGVALLSLLFVYAAVGSSGVPTHPNILDPAHWASVRQWPAFEMTEFEWFHWWPFYWLIGLICSNLIITTLRRIPFNTLHLGVWMIHGGILTLAAGSVWYFSTKVEGDAPVARRGIVIKAPGQPPQRMPAMPGARKVVGAAADAYQFQVVNIDPTWELRSGEEAGRRVYSVTIAVQSKAGQFMRQLLAGHPEFTEDIIRSNDPKQPMARAIKALGRRLVDEALELSLDYEPQQWFYLSDSHALYLRELDPQRLNSAGEPAPKGPWVQRPIEGLPRYNDYIQYAADVFGQPQQSLAPRPIQISVPPADPADPLPQVTFQISRYLRYAHLESRRLKVGDGPLDPAVTVRLKTPAGIDSQYQLIALDPLNNTVLEGAMRFVWVNSIEARHKLAERVEPVISFSFPGTPIQVDEQITATLRDDPTLPFKPIAGTDYAWRVKDFGGTLNIKGTQTSVVLVEIRSPQRTFTRWVFDDPTFNSDRAIAEGVAQHEAAIPTDTAIQTVFRPGRMPAPILLVAGPAEDEIGVLVSLRTGTEYFPLRDGQTVKIAGDVSLTLEKYAPRTIMQTRPMVVPREQRDRDMREMLSMIALDAPDSDLEGPLWLNYHHFAFEDRDQVLRRFPYRPQRVELSDGRTFELMFSRARLPLPAPVVLEDFQVDSHIGGFTGRASSIMDWISIVRFARPVETGSSAGQPGWGEAKAVRVNHPAEHDGYWFFQAQWDPPDGPRFEGDPPSQGLNYTVLGVGNRNGVNVQLAGCIIAVSGMIFTFYGKPIIKRRRQQAALALAGRAAQPRVVPQRHEQLAGAALKAQQS